MIVEAIQKVLGQKPARSALLQHGDETFLYDDGKSAYARLQRIVKQNGHVSNIESFTALVLEEFTRRGSVDGEFGTVTFSTKGATFSPDDRERRDAFLYTRTLSEQWKALASFGVTMAPHAVFVRTLQLLRPSIGEEYARIIRDFRKVQFDARTKVISAPVLTDGKAGSELSIDLELSAGRYQTTALPSELVLTMPYAQGSTKTYGFTVEVDASLREEGEKKTFLLGLIFPDRQNVEDQAIADEVQAFRGACEEGGLSRLLILEDY
jgi:hypothetical protein